MPVQMGMKRKVIINLIASACLIGMGTSCTTTYDRYGRPVQSVDPVVAVAGVVAAGAIGYAIANERGHHYNGHRYRHSGYGHGGHGSYRRGYGHGGYRGNYCRY